MFRTLSTGGSYMGGCPPASRSMGSITTVQRSLPFSVHKTTSYHHSSSSSANPPHQPKNDVPHDSATIAMRYHLTLARIAAANRIEIRSHLPKRFSADNAAAAASKGPIMADKDTKSGEESSTLNDVKKEEKEEKLLPPPPEKPLPGDCCGSGCVRCVWDIYYEELEDYNKLVAEIKSKSNSGSDSKTDS